MIRRQAANIFWTAKMFQNFPMMNWRISEKIKSVLFFNHLIFCRGQRFCEMSCLPLVYAGIPARRTEKSRQKNRFKTPVWMNPIFIIFPINFPEVRCKEWQLPGRLSIILLLILADEPTGNLDTKTGEIVLDTFQTLNKEQNRTIVLITHERYVAEHADRIIHIRDGSIVEDEKVSRKRIINNNPYHKSL